MHFIRVENVSKSKKCILYRISVHAKCVRVCNAWLVLNESEQTSE